MELNALNLSKTLVRQGYNVVLLTTSLPSRQQAHHVDNVDGVEVHYLRGCPPGRYSKEWGRLSVSTFEDLHRRRPFEIVHGHNSAGLYIFRSGILKEYQIPLVTTYHGTHLDWVITDLLAILQSPGIKQKMGSLAEAAVDLYRLVFHDIWLARGSDALIAIDDQAVNKIRLQYFVPSSKVHRIYTSIDTNLFSPRNPGDIRRKFNIGENQPLLLALGRLAPEKGFQNTITALPELAKVFPSIHLLIVGEGPHRGQLEALTKKLDVQSRVTFVGAIAHEESPHYFNACDVFINPTVQIGGYNTTLVEAMACEKVVVTSEGGGTATLIEDGKNGILIRLGAVNELVETTIKVLRDPARAKTIGKNARQRVLERFSLEAMSAATIRLYSLLIETRRQRTRWSRDHNSGCSAQEKTAQW